MNRTGDFLNAMQPLGRLSRRFWRGLVAIVCLAPMHGAANATTTAELLRYLPRDANAIAVINAPAVFDSSLAKQEGWQAKYADAFEASPLIVPPSAVRCVVGAKLDLAKLEPEWEAAAMELSIDPTTAQIVQRRGGTADVVAGADVAWLARQTGVWKIAPRMFGLMTPVTRQELANVVEEAKRGDRRRASPYLAAAASAADGDGTGMTFAIDLSHSFRDAAVRAALAQSPFAKDISVEQAAAVLASVRGVTLGVRVSERLVGKLQFDFAGDAAPLAPVAKPLMLAIVGKSGAMLDEFTSWNATANGNALALDGELTSDGMRRLFSLLTLDSSVVETADAGRATSASASTPPRVPPQSPGSPTTPVNANVAKATLRYFKGVDKYMADVQRLGRANSLQQAVMWIQNYARKITALPRKNVDPDLLKYGDYVADAYRGIVSHAYDLEGQADAAANAAPQITSYNIGLLPTARTVNYGGAWSREYVPYGTAQIDPSEVERQQQQVQSDVDAAIAAARKTLADLATDHETVRKNLSERYGEKF